MLGTKSLEQLVWELKQTNPLSQDKLVQTYLSNTNDLKAEMKLEDEMNLLRHVHMTMNYTKVYKHIF